ncbi:MULTISPECIES: MdtA/MuxA family multidrug efflux RND transporter periplasmic adaptor subunit [Lonsdalea]|uniref:Multidrug transporter subunit MdtA n=2 Tax=Lonsdalea TaxID=1082702 RepID=A0ACD1JC66_9GAMM|nr:MULTISPECIES: MdtA/MuxA family multidrug efflux RND transporter periplasmic adaptor subunit [Lonsdalea]RAT13245.1 multidrug transporter subunit MdtA [Lonsdalea quercina]RAT20894.1 multidrug transporter subunit MdtA [Lonsdalea populi]RAT23611.1 multidrug transporter subunit MdtA [Lonsdalea populi]RAT24317.1 multidrug transporter subunit MdtA [Lonsdalea populi]RAT34850.1 multidrug transporter subunit MdtA [Lonsdalea populi]
MNTKRLFRLLSLIAVIVVVVIAWRYFYSTTPPASSTEKAASNGGRGEGHRSMTTPPVQVARSFTASVPYYLTGLGTVTSANTVTVRSRVSGQLMALHFEEGQQVAAGALLAEIDPRPFEVDVAQAKGQLARDQALLANARRDLARYQGLVKTNLVSRQELDTQASLVKQYEAAVQTDQGALDSALLQLTYSRITAPAGGRVGLRLVDVGNYITSTDDLLVLTQTRPIDAIFSLPEDSIATILKAQKSDRPVVVEAWDRANQQMLSQGRLLSMDNQIDATTGTIKLKARFENSEDRLFPNQFVNIRMKVDTLQNAVLAPASAVQMGNEGHFVWLLNDENQASKHLVSIGIQYGQNVVINSGLNAGEQVVTDGIDRLTEGMKVDVIPSASTEPASTTAGKDRQAKKAETP